MWSIDLAGRHWRQHARPAGGTYACLWNPRLLLVTSRTAGVHVSQPERVLRTRVGHAAVGLAAPQICGLQRCALQHTGPALRATSHAPDASYLVESRRSAWHCLLIRESHLAFEQLDHCSALDSAAAASTSVAAAPFGVISATSSCFDHGHITLKIDATVFIAAPGSSSTACKLAP